MWKKSIQNIKKTHSKKKLNFPQHLYFHKFQKLNQKFWKAQYTKSDINSIEIRKNQTQNLEKLD